MTISAPLCIFFCVFSMDYAFGAIYSTVNVAYKRKRLKKIYIITAKMMIYVCFFQKLILDADWTQSYISSNSSGTGCRTLCNFHVISPTHGKLR